jgi:phosphoserine aminotransferase
MINFNPGPSQLYPTVPTHIAAALESGILTASHRSGAYSDMHGATVAALRELMGIPPDYHAWFLGSATEGLERIVQNTVRTTSHHFVSGAFAERFYEAATGLGKTPSIKRAEWGEAFDLDSEQIPGPAELITITQNETSTGARIDPSAISRLHQRYPDKLIAVDIVSSAPFVQLDWTAADCVVFSVQKGFGLPAGLGVLIASPRALERSRQLQESGVPIGSFHSFPELALHEQRHQTPETPNILGIYLLGAVARDMLAYGPDRLRSELSAQAKALYEFFDGHPHYDILPRSEYRSETVIVAAHRSGARPVMDSLSVAHFHLGPGYGKTKDSHFRIANFPAHIGHTERLIELFGQHAAKRTTA